MKIRHKKILLSGVAVTVAGVLGEIENEIVIFKEALYLGYDLADVFFNRR